MKRSVIIIVLAIVSFVFMYKTKGQTVAAMQAGFTVKVKMPNPNHYKVLISYRNGENFIMDTSYVMHNGYMLFKGNLNEIGQVSFVVRNPNNVIKNGDGFLPGPGLSFVARNGATVTIEVNAEKPYMATVYSTDKETMAYETFRAKDKVWVNEKWALTKERFSSSVSTKVVKENEKAIQLVEEKQKIWAMEFVKMYPNTYAAIEVFATYALDLSDDEQAKQFAALPSTYKGTELGKIISEKIKGTAATSEGKDMISFSQKGYNGSIVDLAALKGKVVLIDFWGSWCSPCRASFPHLKELYTKYKDKGFEIVGVAKENGSGESQLKTWAAAIKEDGINWLNVLNNAGQTDIVKSYGVVQFPTKILIDKDGIIQGRYVGDQEDDLEKRLIELLESSGKASPVKMIRTGN